MQKMLQSQSTTGQSQRSAMSRQCMQPWSLLLSILLLTASAASEDSAGSASLQDSDAFRILALPGTFTSCRRLLQQSTRYLPQCLAHWLQLQRQNAEPGFVRYAPSDEAESCEISVWCDQLLANESDPHTALLPVSRGQPRIMLFAVKSGSQLKVLDSFLTPAGCNRSLLVSPAVGPPPLDFWRSCWLDRLPDLMALLAGKTLSVEILKAGATVLKISFDASFAGLNLLNWFSETRLVGSEPALALVGRSYNFFSVVGDSHSLRRGFFVNMAYGGCSNDAGVMAVMENNDVCSWGLTGSSSTALPRILYNPAAGLWDNHAVLADYLLVTTS